MQLWIEGLTSYESWLQQGNSGTPPSFSLERQVKDMRVFDLLIRNTDRNQGNIVWDENNNLWLIDHTRSLARDSNLRAPESFKGCSRRMLEAVRNLDEGAVEARLKPYLGTFEIKALSKRREKLLKLIETEIKKKGEDEVLFNYGDPPKGMVIQYDDASA